MEGAEAQPPNDTQDDTPKSVPPPTLLRTLQPLQTSTATSASHHRSHIQVQKGFPPRKMRKSIPCFIQCSGRRRLPRARSTFNCENQPRILFEGSTSGGPSWKRVVKNRLISEEAKLSEKQKPPCTIYMVPSNIRECNRKAYDPQVVSIGPYHKDDRHPFARDDSTMQNYKWRCLHYLFRRRLLNGGIEEVALLDQCLDTMMGLIPEVRSCYFDDDTHTIRQHDDDEQLALMMLLDGCFIITHLLTSTPSDVGSHYAAANNGTPNRKIVGPSHDMMWIDYSVEYDLLKLENQIPFFVLEELFAILEVSAEIDGHIILINKAIKLFQTLVKIPATARAFAPSESTNNILHLLHLFHLYLTSHEEQGGRGGGGSNRKRYNNTDVENPYGPQWIPSATKLCRSGIKFRRKKSPRNFLDVTFKKGVMEIPQLEIFDHTETLIRNLIAFEQCYPHTQMEITAYTMFMDCIVDTPEDVNLLHLKGIFVNCLSTDEAVADLFNGLCNQINYSLNFNFLSELFIDVTRYHRSNWHNHKAKLKRDYFSSPWTTISVIAACILLLLTMEQSFFAAYSYFRPT